ncbi:hypothetical protein AALB53_03730 [Lachnospiraceae bacterium 47-T17]
MAAIIEQSVKAGFYGAFREIGKPSSASNGISDSVKEASISYTDKASAISPGKNI